MNYIIRQWNLWFNKKNCVQIILDKNFFKHRDICITQAGVKFMYLGKNWFKKIK